MKFGLGVETGGTFTDAAVVNLDSKEVLVKSKSPTTYHDLSIGILGAIDSAIVSNKIDVSEIKLVGLSTTLATNSILQGREGEVGLIGIEWTPQAEWQFGCKKARFIKGGYDSMGRKGEVLDENATGAAIDDMSPEVEAILVSGMFSVANASQELHAKAMIKEKGDVPVVLGHEITSEVGIYERTVSASLNAKLLPIMRDFLDSVKSLFNPGGSTPLYMCSKATGGS